MFASLARCVMAGVLCPLLGAMLGRSLATGRGGDAEMTGWLGGAAVGLLYAIVLWILMLSRRGSRKRAVADLVLLVLSLLALADVASQLTRTSDVHLLPATACLYALGFVVALFRAMRPERV